MRAVYLQINTGKAACANVTQMSEGRGDSTCMWGRAAAIMACGAGDHEGSPCYLLLYAFLVMSFPLPTKRIRRINSVAEAGFCDPLSCFHPSGQGEIRPQSSSQSLKIILILILMLIVMIILIITAWLSFNKASRSGDYNQTNSLCKSSASNSFLLNDLKNIFF